MLICGMWPLHRRWTGSQRANGERTTSRLYHNDGWEALLEPFCLVVRVRTSGAERQVGKIKVPVPSDQHLGDGTNGDSVRYLSNPCAQIQHARSGRREGEVSRTSVMCSNAPGSWSGSRVRGAPEGGVDVRDRKEKRSESGVNGSRRRRRKDGLPILSRTTSQVVNHFLTRFHLMRPVLLF